MVDFTPSSDRHSPVLPELQDQIPEGEEIGTVTADCAYDTRRCHTAIIDRQAPAIIPILKTTALKRGLSGRSRTQQTLRATRHYGRAFGKHWTGTKPVQVQSLPNASATRSLPLRSGASGWGAPCPLAMIGIPIRSVGNWS